MFLLAPNDRPILTSERGLEMSSFSLGSISLSSNQTAHQPGRLEPVARLSGLELRGFLLWGTGGSCRTKDAGWLAESLDRQATSSSWPSVALPD